MPAPTPADLLDFERAHPRHNGSKEEKIIRELGIGPARYYQLLARVAASPEGMQHDPLTARRVRERGSRRLVA
ncbi:DUF3263 domain-containing protein [Microbacterium album]|nr:DUF3263 domain-containing protein [Microbacterium album]